MDGVQNRSAEDTNRSFSERVSPDGRPLTTVTRTGSPQKEQEGVWNCRAHTQGKAEHAGQTRRHDRQVSSTADRLHARPRRPVRETAFSGRKGYGAEREPLPWDTARHSPVLSACHESNALEVGGQGGCSGSPPANTKRLK